MWVEHRAQAQAERDHTAQAGQDTTELDYTYDLGACWEHEITLEQTLPRGPGQDDPV